MHDHTDVLRIDGKLEAPFQRAINLEASNGSIETQMRTKIGKLQGTKYKDEFDWSLYDRIAEKLPRVPKGGVVFGTTLKLVNYHSTCTRCHYALEIDSYGRGCFHNCEYCYAKDRLLTRGYWNRPQPFPVDLAEIRKIFYKVFETNKTSKWRTVLEKKVPIRIGSMSDSFMWIDTKYGVTKELLKILNFYRYPYVIFTRSDLVAHDDYLPLLDPELAAVQISVCGNNHSLIRFIEPGAPPYSKRLNALAKLKKAGVWSTVRINPFFPKHPDGYFSNPTLIEKKYGSLQNAPIFNLYNDNFIEEIASTGVSSFLIGAARLSTKAVKAISTVTKVPLKDFFLPEVWSKNGDKHFSSSEMSHYYSHFHAEAKKHNLRFSTCYIGNGVGEYFQHQNLWSNKKDCCDVVGNVSSFKTTAQSVPWAERTKHASSKIEANNGFISDPEIDNSTAIDVIDLVWQ